jgi:hypothetical protein
MRIKQDIAAGLVFAASGVLGLWLGREYDFGEALNMGPGYLPTLLCWGLIGLGAIIAINGAATDGEIIGRWWLRPLLFVLAAVAVFALLIESAGLALAVAATTVLAAFAGEQFRIVETVVLAIVLAASSVAIFIYGLSLPLSALPS